MAKAPYFPVNASDSILSRRCSCRPGGSTDPCICQEKCPSLATWSTTLADYWKSFRYAIPEGVADLRQLEAQVWCATEIVNIDFWLTCFRKYCLSHRLRSKTSNRQLCKDCSRYVGEERCHLLGQTDAGHGGRVGGLEKHPRTYALWRTTA